MKNKSLKTLSIITIILAIVCATLTFGASNQAYIPVPFEIEFIGEYSYDGENWHTYTKESELLETKGEVILKGNFNEELFEGATINVLCDHVGLEVYLNQELIYMDAVAEMISCGEKPKPSMCGIGWGKFISPMVTAEDKVEIHLISYHEHSNKHSFEEAMNSICIAPDDNIVLPSYFAPYLDPVRIVGFGLLTIAVLLFGASIYSLVLRSETVINILSMALITAFVSGYILSDIMALSPFTEHIDIKTYGRQLCMMLALFFIMLRGNEALKGKTKKIAEIAIWISGLVNIAIIVIVSLRGILIFETQYIWAIVNLILCVSLICVYAYDMARRKKPNGEAIACICIYIAVILDMAGVGYNIYCPGICAKVTFVIVLAAYLIYGGKSILTNYQASLKNKKLQEELENSRIAVMISQIQPHFLYNSLTSVMDLCDRDSKQAKNAIADFADYLRGNMEALNTKELIPFHRELEHIEKYLKLEKLRFQDDIHIEYDIQTVNFTLPPLSVQPLVENAIKHGIGKKSGGGTVIISTKEDKYAYIIGVSDDGVGFEESNYKKDGAIHVGLANIRWRLETMMDAQLEIKSEIGKGTTATIRIPKRRD